MFKTQKTISTLKPLHLPLHLLQSNVQGKKATNLYYKR